MARQLVGMPQFLRFLSTLPAPDPVAAALVRGPLARLRAVAGSIHVLHDDRLVTVGNFGYRAQERDRYAEIPLSAHVPFGTAVHENRIVVEPTNSLLARYPLLAVDERTWVGIIGRIGIGVLVSAPITDGGAVVGAYGFLAGDADGVAGHLKTLSGLSALLGLWLANPATPGLTPTPRRRADDAPLGLTDRQRQVLAAVASGATNAAIAAELGYSTGTVKQELQRVMRTLNVADRQAAVERARALRLL